MLLLFANAFGAIATAYALTGSSLNIVTILLYAQIRGDVLHNPDLGYALALGMIVITAALQRRLHLASRSGARAVAAMKRSAPLALDRRRPRRALFPRAADRHASSSRCACDAGEYSFDAYPIVLADPAFQPTFGYSVVVGVVTIVVGSP